VNARVLDFLIFSLVCNVSVLDFGPNLECTPTYPLTKIWPNIKKKDLKLPIICAARMKLGPIYFLKKKITHNLNIVHENINNYIE